jgi:hypothetical protein
MKGLLQPDYSLLANTRYGLTVQVNWAVPLTLGDVLLIPLLTVMFRSAGACAVMVTCPTAIQVALPLSLMVAILVFDDDHVSPSATVSSRLVLLVNVAVAVY